MANPTSPPRLESLRQLPSTDEILSTAVAQRLVPEAGRRVVTSLARAVLAGLRQELTEELRMGTGDATRDTLLGIAAHRLESAWNERKAAGLRKVINATGVIVHTNLGRAPFSAQARDALMNAAGYATVEYDLPSGKRGRRGASVERLLAELTGAEAAVVVNNCAAAAFLVLSVFAKGHETIVSRGELVEIGGDFRIPDVLTQSGSRLVEVGTTNRTKLADYERAISENTAVVMRVHPSNYRIVGFTSKPGLDELATLCRKRNVLLYEDAGSGALGDLSAFGLNDEPVIGRSIADGADIVTFSGDKLLGGSQAGLIVGTRKRIEEIRKHPLYRALRADKLSYAVLEATLNAYLREDAMETVPVLRMLSATNEEMLARANDFAERLKTQARGFAIEVVEGDSVVGGGAAPETPLPSHLIAITHSDRSPESIEARLRMSSTPVIARIDDGRLLLDLRTVEPADEKVLFEMVASALG